MPDVHMPLKKHILTYAMHLYICIFSFSFIYTWSKIGVCQEFVKLEFVRNLSGVVQMQSGVRGGGGLISKNVTCTCLMFPCHQCVPRMLRVEPYFLVSFVPET